MTKHLYLIETYRSKEKEDGTLDECTSFWSIKAYNKLDAELIAKAMYPGKIVNIAMVGE